MTSKARLAVLMALFLAVACFDVMAQVESTMHFMKSLPQVAYYNPALKPAYRFSFGLPGSSVFAQYTNNGFTYNDFISRQNNTLVADLDQLYSALRTKNFINASAQADLFRLSIKINPRLYLTHNITLKSYNRFMLPKDITGLLINGTDAYVNNTASLSPELESMTYAEIGWGAAYTVNKKLTVGAKLKLLKGAANITTENAAFNLSLSDTYAITVSGNADVRTSGIQNFDNENYDLADDWRDFLKNNGFALDLGATYQVMDRLTVGLSLIDLGGITWKNNAYGYKLDPAKATYTFEGVDIDDVLNGDISYGESLADSIETYFKFSEGTIGSYRTPLPGKMYLSGSYQLKHNTTLGALFFAETFRGRFMPGMTASINKEFGQRLGASLSYTVTNNSFNNLGAGLSLNLSPIQIYLVGDNLLRIPFTYLGNKNINGYVNSLQYFTLRTGINFIFGRELEQEKLPHSKTTARK